MGASRIQGITVEIGGDTTKLTAALKGVNGEIRTTQSQLRDVERLLKLDPGNTELLAQKHRLLADAVRETKEKLETLKAAAEQANEALAKGEITQEQYDGLQREIIETEERLKSLEEQASQSAVAVQKIAAVGEDLKNLGDKISGVGTTLTKTVTTPIVGLGTMAVKTAADFDSAMSQVGAVSGATGKDLDALRDKARGTGRKGCGAAFPPCHRFAVTVLRSFLLLLSAGISLKTWPCSRKIPTGRRASQTGINSTSAMRVLLADVAVDQ